jgi:cyclopropane-fatty-acyl-phospholipid synthase
MPMNLRDWVQTVPGAQRGRRHPRTVQWLAQFILEWAANRWRTGTLHVTYPGGYTRSVGTGLPMVDLRVLTDDLFPVLLMGGEIGLGDAYVDGLWESDDLAGLLALGIRNRQLLALDRWPLTLPLKIARRVRHLARRNTRAGSRRNIAAHYDLSNDFFRLWLDETMTYSCAIFRSAEDTLAEAQISKLEEMCQLASLAPAQRVLEIGGGWGSFAMHAARTRGCTVTSLTISETQFAMATRRVREAGLGGLVEIRLQDYRDVQGEFDRIVSIEMLEAVGLEYLEAYFRVCDRLLRSGGIMAVQTIVVPERALAAQQSGVNWIQLRIFPGGALPSRGAIERAIAGTSLRILAVQDIGLHYSETLRHWRNAFQAHLSEVRALGFDEQFVRMWTYYLASCEASFRAGITTDLQLVLQKAG